jgi:hypothetical protein
MVASIPGRKPLGRRVFIAGCIASRRRRSWPFNRHSRVTVDRHGRRSLGSIMRIKRNLWLALLTRGNLGLGTRTRCSLSSASRTGRRFGSLMSTAMPTWRRRMMPVMPFTRRVRTAPVPVRFLRLSTVFMTPMRGAIPARVRVLSLLPVPVRLFPFVPGHVVGVSMMPSCLLPGNQKFVPGLQPIRMLA